MAHVYACFALCNNLVCKTCNIDVHVDCFQDLCFYKHVHLFAILQLLQICKFGWEVGRLGLQAFGLVCTFASFVFRFANMVCDFAKSKKIVFIIATLVCRV